MRFLNKNGSPVPFFFHISEEISKFFYCACRVTSLSDNHVLHDVDGVLLPLDVKQIIAKHAVQCN